MAILRIVVTDTEESPYKNARVRVEPYGKAPVMADGGLTLVKPAWETTDDDGVAEFTLRASADLMPANTPYAVYLPTKTKPVLVEMPAGLGTYTLEDVLVDPPGALETAALSAHRASVGDHTDVDLTDNATGKVLMWNGTKFVPADTVATDLEVASAIAVEAEDRSDADVAILAAVDLEEAARIAGDTAEATARQNADATIQANLDAEEDARIAADAAEAAARLAHGLDETDVHGLGDAREHEYAIDDVSLTGAYRRSIYRANVAEPCIVVIVDDDADRSSVDYVAVQLRSRSLVGNFALTWDYLGTTGKITLSEAKALQDEGHEIVDHSRTHTDITGAPDEWAKFRDETVDNAARFEAANIRIDAFKDPGDWDGYFEGDSKAKTLDRYGRLMRSRYAAWSRYLQDDVWNYTRPRPSLHSYGPGAALTVDGITSLATLTGAIDSGITYRGLVYFAMHSRNLDQPGSLTKANFEAMLDYVAARRDEGKLVCMTYTQAVHAGIGPRENLLTDSFFEASTTGNYVGWRAVSPAGGTPAVGSGGEVGSKISVNSANSVIQEFRADNLRSIEFHVRAKPAVATATSTLRLRIRQVDGTGTTIASPERDVTLAASMAWQDARVFTRMDPRAKRAFVWLTSPNATFSEVSSAALMRV